MTTRAFCLAFLLLASACDNRSGCTSGTTQVCRCGSLSGTQSCGGDGTFGACMCSGSDAGLIDAGSPPDASSTADAGASPDAGSPGDGGRADGATTDGGGSPTDCDFTGWSPTHSEAFSYPDTSGPDSMSLHLTTDHESLWLDLLFDSGAQDTPHTFTFTGENYADCSECLLLYAECPTPDSTDCATAYMAVSGTVSYSELTRTSLTGTLENIRMIEVTVGDDFVSTLVPDGQVWCIPSLSFMATATDPAL